MVWVKCVFFLEIQVSNKEMYKKRKDYITFFITEPFSSLMIKNYNGYSKKESCK